MKMEKKSLFIIIILFLFITSCKRQTNIYIIGSEIDHNDKSIAVLWINDNKSYLNDGKNDTFVNSVFVSGSDTYVVGYEYINFKAVACIWKNGIKTVLPNETGNAFAQSVYVSGTDVYVVGHSDNGKYYKATIWKNGEKTYLDDEEERNFATAIFLSGSDVYIIGTEGTNNILANRLVLWKNGKKTYLTDGGNNDSYEIGAESIYVSGEDVYIVGYERQKVLGRTNATAWKNGVLTRLTDGKNMAYAKSVFISDSMVYIVGHEMVNDNYIAVLWENGVRKNLTDGTNPSYAESVFVLRNDVYIVGYEVINDKAIAVYWKNGEKITLSDQTDAWTTSIFVQEGRTIQAISERQTPKVNQFNNTNNDELMLNGVWASLPYDTWRLSNLTGGSVAIFVFDTNTKTCQIGVKNYVPSLLGIYVQGDFVGRKFLLNVNTRQKNFSVIDDFGDSTVFRYVFSEESGQKLLKLKDANGIITDLYEWDGKNL